MTKTSKEITNSNADIEANSTNDVEEQSSNQQSSNHLQPDTNISGGGRYQKQVILASAGYDHTIRFWNAEKGFCERIISHNENHHVNAMAITPNREILAAAGFQHIRLYDIEGSNSSNNPLVNFEGLPSGKNVTAIGFNQVGNWIYTGGEDGYVRLWDVRCRTLQCQRERIFQTPINSVLLHPNGIEIYIADQSGSIYIWNLQSEELQRLFVTNDGFVNSLDYDKESRMLAALDTRGNAYIFRNTAYVPWNNNSTEEPMAEVTLSGYLHRRLMFQAHQKHGIKCRFSPDSTLLATASADRTTKLWRTADLLIQNPSSTVTFADPFGNEKGPTGPADTAGVLSRTGSFKRRSGAFKGGYNDVDVAEDPSDLMIRSYYPYLANLHGSGPERQAPRPPPCYMRPRRSKKNCPVCTGEIPADTESSSLNTSDNNQPRTTYHTADCPGSLSLFNGAGNGMINLQPNLNSFSQLTWNIYGSKGSPSNTSTPNANITRCPHYSHSASSSQSSNSRSSNVANGSATNVRNGPHHMAHSHHHQSFQNMALSGNMGGGHIPNYYGKYFRNPYYMLHSKPHESGPKPNELLKENQKEDKEFFRVMKRFKLLDLNDDYFEDDFDEEDESIDSDTDEENDDSESEDSSNGEESFDDNTKKSWTIHRKKKSSRSSNTLQTGEYCCCTCCEICSEISNEEEEESNDEMNKRLKHSTGKSARIRRLSSKDRHAKNDWPYTNQLTPAMVLTDSKQRWVWDIAYSADSQYIFTGSSDQVIRLWSVFTGKMTREYNGHQRAITCLAFSDII